MGKTFHMPNKSTKIIQLCHGKTIVDFGGRCASTNPWAARGLPRLASVGCLANMLFDDMTCFSSYLPINFQLYGKSSFPCLKQPMLKNSRDRFTEEQAFKDEAKRIRGRPGAFQGGCCVPYPFRRCFPCWPFDVGASEAPTQKLDRRCWKRFVIAETCRNHQNLWGSNLSNHSQWVCLKINTTSPQDDELLVLSHPLVI